MIKVNTEIITPDNAATLLPFCPDPEELEIAKHWDGDKNNLDGVIILIRKIKIRKNPIFTL